MKEDCIKCKGTGLSGTIETHGRLYKIVCDRCYGQKKVYWTENIMPQTHERLDSFDMLTCALLLEHMYEPDNYIIPAPGRIYYLREEFFLCSKDNIEEKYQHLIMATTSKD